MCFVYLCTYYCIHAIKWFCQEPLFCGVFVAADLKICRHIPDIIKSVIPTPWERGKKQTAFADAKVFSSCFPSFSPPGSPCSLIHCSSIIPYRLGTEASTLMVLLAGRLLQTVIFSCCLITSSGRKKKMRFF